MNETKRFYEFILRRGSVLLLLLAGIGFFRYLFRDLWFDECLTFELVQFCQSPGEVYRSYYIPNNHIIFSILFQTWADLWIGTIDNVPVLLFRFLPVIAGFLTVILLYRILRRTAGRFSAWLGTALFLLAPPFLIYATGIRGYGLSVLFVLAGYIAARNWMGKGRKRDCALWFLWAFLGMGTTPTNLAAFTAIAILSAPALWCPGKRMRWSLLFLIPFAAGLLFYLPIWDKLLACMKLGEGWNSRWTALWDLYAPALLMFLPMAAFLRKDRVRRAPRYAITFLLTLLMPLGVYLIFPVPPFPRVFLPLLAVWVIPLTHFAAPALRKGTEQRKMLIACVFFFWSALLLLFSPKLSDALFGSAWEDDLLAPYYTRDQFLPSETVRRMELCRKEQPGAIFFLTFEADYPALLFAAMSWADRDNVICYDKPNEPRLTTLPESVPLYFVTRSAADMESARKRFALPQPIEMEQIGQHCIWRMR